MVDNLVFIFLVLVEIRERFVVVTTLTVGLKL